jgi:hypothetical protein
MGGRKLIPILTIIPLSIKQVNQEIVTAVIKNNTSPITTIKINS